MPFLPSLVLIVESWAVTLTRQVCDSLILFWILLWPPGWVLAVHLESFWWASHSWETSPLFQVYSIWHNDFHCDSLEAQSLRHGFAFLPRLYCSGVSLDCGMMCCFLRYFNLLHFVRQIIVKDFFWFNRSASSQAGVYLVKLNSAFQKMWLIAVNSWLTHGATTFG